MTDHPTSEPWWQPLRLETGQTGRLRIGALDLAIYRDAREWLVVHQEVEDQEDPDWSFERTDARPEEGEQEIERHVFRHTDERLWLRPALADRAVVTKPRVPLFVPPGEETTLYIGSPVWIRIETGEPPTLLGELPIRRPSDTWFGPNTREGELCYATRTSATIELDNLPRTTRWVRTALCIQNRAEEPLPVEKVQLPVLYLSVFHAAASGLLWTESVTLVHEEAGDLANLDVHDEPPGIAGETELLTEPRERPEGRLLLRAFGSLFR